MNETKFKEVVMQDLKQLPFTWVLKTQERGRHGTPDLLICMNGKFVAIELKRDGGKIMKIQTLTLEKIQKAGGVAFVASPSSWGQQYMVLRTLV